MKLKIDILSIILLLSVACVGVSQQEQAPQSTKEFTIGTEDHCSQEYDMFDLAADDMVARGMEAEKPLPPSKIGLWARIVGCYVLNGYFAAQSAVQRYWLAIKSLVTRKKETAR